MSTGGVDQGGYRYTAFGETYDSDPDYPAPTGIYDLPIRWKGAWLMYSTGNGPSRVDLYDMRARWWWPQGGVFVSADDFEFHDSRSTLWAWAGQNPLRWSDPSGNDPLPASAQVALAPYFPTLDLSKVDVQVVPQASLEYSNTALQYDYGSSFSGGATIYAASAYYDPDSPLGLSLIAHELTHAVQDQQYNEGNPFRSFLRFNTFAQEYGKEFMKHGATDSNFLEWLAYNVQQRVYRELSCDKH